MKEAFNRFFDRLIISKTVIETFLSVVLKTWLLLYFNLLFYLFLIIYKIKNHIREIILVINDSLTNFFLICITFILSHKYFIMSCLLGALSLCIIYYLTRMINAVMTNIAFLKKRIIESNRGKKTVGLKVFPVLVRFFRIKVKKGITYKIYSMLMLIGERIENNPLFPDPFQLSIRLHALQKRVIKTVAPYIAPFTTLFIHKKYEPLKDLDDLKLMDEAKLISSPDNIPQPILQKIHSPAAVADIVIIKEWQNMFDEVYNRWESGFYSSLLISGESGSGKTTLLNYLAHKHRTRNTYYIPAVRGIDIFSDRIISRIEKIAAENTDTGDKQIILIDDIELLFLKKIEGFYSLKKLLILIEKTKSYILWIITINKYALHYLNTFFYISSIFQFELHLSNITTQQLTDIYYKKLKNIHYNYKIIANKELIKEIKRKVSHRIIAERDIERFLKNRFFRLLKDNKGINYKYFNFYFIRSVKKVIKNNIWISLPDFLQIDTFKKCSIDYLFILHSILLHKHLSEHDLTTVLHYSRDFITVALSIFLENNILFKYNGKYGINAPVYFELTKFLQLKKLI